MRKGVIILLTCAIAFSAWGRGSTEPKPAPAPPAAPAIRITMPQVYLRSVGLPWVHYEVQMTVPVSFWTDGHREFAGSPSFQVTAIPRHPYYLELPQYSTMKVTRTNYLIVVNIVRVYQRLMVFDPLTGVDIYTSFPLVQYQPFTFTFTP